MSLQVSAAQAVGEHLLSPDDLNKTALLRKRLAKEKASIDAKLKSGVKDQLDATRDGLKKLFSTRANVQAVKDEMVTIERMGRESTSQIKTFDQINAVRFSMIYACSLHALWRCASGMTGPVAHRQSF
jgi:exocyst complex component 3